MGRFIIALGALLVAAVAVTASARAETFPSRTIRIIVPYAPGGSIDLTARVIAKNLQDSVGQSVIVENKPGANAGHRHRRSDTKRAGRLYADHPLG